MVPEAAVERTDDGLVPKGDGWYVVNAREARWWDYVELGRACDFEGDVRFEPLGINIWVLRRGEPNCMYHGEGEQEDFLVLFGECLLVVEGEERPLRQWDFVDCPPWTEHVFVGAGDGPCAIVMVGTRSKGGVVYTANETARRHGAAVERETRDNGEAYARFTEPRPMPYPDGILPS